MPMTPATARTGEGRLEAVWNRGDGEADQPVGAHLRAARQPAAPTPRLARWCAPAAARCAAGRPEPSPTGRGRAAPRRAAAGRPAGLPRHLRRTHRGRRCLLVTRARMPTSISVDPTAVYRMKRCPASVRARSSWRSPNRLISTHIGTRTAEGDEEEHGVAGGEGGECTRLDDEQAAEGGRRGATLGHVDPGVRGDEHPDERREEHERHGDAVDAERPAHADGAAAPRRRRAARRSR